MANTFGGDFDLSLSRLPWCVQQRGMPPLLQTGTTVGWKGLINDADPDGRFRINRGMCLARGLLLKIRQLGVPVACEFLDVITPQYIADLVTWGAHG